MVEAKKTEKVPFEYRIPCVFKIIKESRKPLKKVEVHEKLKAVTGVKISVHTLDKCLEFLVSDNQVQKTKEKGKAGNPVLYSVDEFLYSHVSFPGDLHSYDSFSDDELLHSHEPFSGDLHPLEPFSGDIKCYVRLFEKAKNEGDARSIESSERTHYIEIIQKIQTIVRKLIDELHSYASTKQKQTYKAAIHYDTFLKAWILPALRKRKELVKAPVMSQHTYEKVLKVFGGGLTRVMRDDALKRLNGEMSHIL